MFQVENYSHICQFDHNNDHGSLLLDTVEKDSGHIVRLDDLFFHDENLWFFLDSFLELDEKVQEFHDQMDS